MKKTRILWMICAVLPLAGCASNQGGTSEAETGGYETTTNGTYEATTNQSTATWDTSQVYPEPAGNTRFRPGMNTRDPRDAHFRPSTPPGQLVPPTLP